MTTDKDSARPFDYGIDWSGFDKYEESVCDCRCGTSFLSHDKLIKDGDRLKIVTRKPCPSCGRNDDIRAVHGPTEKRTTHTTRYNSYNMAYNCPQFTAIAISSAGFGRREPASSRGSTPLTVGELEYGDKFIGFPRDGDDSGHGGFRNGSYIFVKARGDMNAVRLMDGVATEQPDGMLVLKVIL